VGSGVPIGWRTRVQLDVGPDGRAGFHRYHSSELVTDLRCAQLPGGMLGGLDGPRWRPGGRLHVVLDDDGRRHVLSAAADRRDSTMVEGGPTTVARVGDRVWRLPVTAFWQAHREAAAGYSDLVRQWLDGRGARRAWDLYGGAGLFAAALADVVGATGQVITVDTARNASGAARTALADLPVRVVAESVRRFLAAQSRGADVAVLDPPRAGAGGEVIGLLAGAGVRQVVHLGCEAASFARDIGLYRSHGYRVAEIRVFDAFPLTHHVECFALLERT
jgi:tRNA/tmRNA/rRNA uracil-C5-methylase (TrmA/RlmC/RlmD family)